MKPPNLIRVMGNGFNSSKHPLRHWGPACNVGHRQNSFLYLRTQVQQTHYLGHPGPGDPFLPGDFRLAGDFSGFQESLPLDGFSEEFDYSGGLWFPGRFGVTTAGWNSAYHLTWRRSSRQGAYVAVFKRPLGPEGDFDHLFAVGHHRGVTLAILGQMENPEIDLRLDPSWAGSHTVTFGEPWLFEARGWDGILPRAFSLPDHAFLPPRLYCFRRHCYHHADGTDTMQVRM